jgi:hypothetical protein
MNEPHDMHDQNAPAPAPGFGLDGREELGPERVARRRVLKAAAAAGTFAAVSTGPRITSRALVPDYAAAATALDPCASPTGLVRMLAWSDKTSESRPNSEFRADFVLRMPTGVSISSFLYKYSPDATGEAARSASLTANNTHSPDDRYRVISEYTPTGAACKLVTVSVSGDWAVENTDYVRYAARMRITLSNSTVISIGQSTPTATGIAIPGAPYGFDTTYFNPNDGAGRRPIVMLPWDSSWANNPVVLDYDGMSRQSTSQSGWGRIIPGGGLSGNVFIIHPINPATGTNDCNGPPYTSGSGSATSVRAVYQWAKETGPGVFTLVNSPTTIDLPNNDSRTGSNFLRLGQDFTAAGFGPGYYKLLVWPILQARTTENCTARHNPYDVTAPNSVANLANAWTVGSAFYNYVPSV